MPIEEAPLVRREHYVILACPNFYKWRIAAGFINDPLFAENIVEFRCQHGDDGRYHNTTERIKLLAVVSEPGSPKTHHFVGIWLGQNGFNDPPRPIKYAIGAVEFPEWNTGHGWFDYYHDTGSESGSRILVPKLTLGWGVVTETASPLRH